VSGFGEPGLAYLTLLSPLTSITTSTSLDTLRATIQAMIGLASGAEASIKPFDPNQPYDEYDLPRKPHPFADGDQIRYFEAVTRERFGMVIQLPIDFHFQGWPVTGIKCRIDAPDYIDSYLTGPCIECSQSFEYQPSRTETYIFNLDSYVIGGFETGGYADYGFAFQDRAVLVSY
jgi:hypothetical protein